MAWPIFKIKISAKNGRLMVINWIYWFIQEWHCTVDWKSSWELFLLKDGTHRWLNFCLQNIKISFYDTVYSLYVGNLWRYVLLSDALDEDGRPTVCGQLGHSVDTIQRLHVEIHANYQHTITEVKNKYQ